MMKIDYLPDTGFRIDSNEIRWGETRESVRRKFLNAHRQDDHVINVSEFFDDDSNLEIHQKEDIYENFSGNNLFFCAYDKDDCLNEFEVHRGIDVVVSGIALTFEKEISEVIREVEKLGHHPVEIEGGNFFFEELKMTIATDEAMGGESTGLAYFYAAKDVRHLTGEE
jgi:hypothetical protein